MKKFTTEQEVFNKLHVKDFCQMLKANKMAKFASIFPNVSPEVATKILDQFPSFAEAMMDMASHFTGTLEKAVDSGSRSTTQSLAICQSIIDGLKDQLNKADLSFEERKFCVERMQYVAECVKEINVEHHSFILKCGGYACLGGIVFVSVLWRAFGGNFNFSIPNN